MANKQKLTIIIAVVAVLLIFVAWYIFSGMKSVPTAQAPTPVAVTSSPTVASTTTSVSLGTSIYQQSQNPIQNKVPGAQNPAVNPIQGAYKNPF